MNKQQSYFLKVGVAVFISGAFVVWLVIFITGLASRGKTFTAIFKDAKGIRSGEIAEMAGVTVGQVANVSLTPDNQAQLKVSINHGVRIPLDSHFKISGSLIGNSNTLTILPSSSPEDLPDGATVIGDSSDPLTETMNKAPELEESLQQTLQKSQVLLEKLTQTTELLNDPRRIAKLDRTLTNIELATASFPRVEASLERQVEDVAHQADGLLRDMDSTNAAARNAVSGAGKLADSMNATIQENRGTLRNILKNANETASEVAGLTGELRDTLGDKDFKKTLAGASQNMAATAQNLQSLSAKLDAAASDVQRLADDPRMNADVRETVSNLRATSESVKNVAARIEGLRLPGEHRAAAPADSSEPSTPPAPHYFSSTSLLEPGLVFDSLYDTTMKRLRFDADYTLLHGNSGAFYRAGLYDASYTDRLNLEAGQGLFNDRMDYRYGLIAGKLGAGFDLRAGPLDFRLDAYDPNHGTLNARAKAHLNSNLSITGGMDSLGRGNYPTVGLQYQK